MKKIVGVSFTEVGKIYWFNPGFLTLEKGSKVVVETVRGLELANVEVAIKEVEDSELTHELKDVIRVADSKDLKQYEENLKQAEKSFVRVKEIIDNYKLDMKLLGCEYTLDATKLLIYYNAEGRVDFRELVKALASEFKLRIELRQIGPREGAKIIGAIGTCGREVCCKKHMREFDLVTMKMAKEQGMALSSTKIAGVCGKLMCCIAYENKVYEDAKKIVPGVGDIVKTPTCDRCKVITADYLREIIKTENDGAIEQWNANEVIKIKSSKNKEEKLTADELKLED
jgi:cell fate regulator YaaT (PSP1 superfamily)